MAIDEDPSFGATSSSLRTTCIASHDGMVATRLARWPHAIDLSCGFQSHFPSGTCSSARRDRPTSRSSSASRKSFVVMMSGRETCKVWTSPCYIGMAEVAMGLLLAVLLLMMIFSVPAWPYSAGWGYYPSGGVLMLLIILMVVFFSRPRRTI